ncbi:MAG: ABC transporter permease [Gammaproteobacteria bacterium]
MNTFRLGLKLLGRDLRSGELTLLMLALIIAVTSSTTVSLFADRLHRTMTLQTAEFLAADLVITSPAKAPAGWMDKAGQLSLEQAHTVEFSSVLIENDELLLAGVKAVSSHYPLRGYLKTTQADYSIEALAHRGPGNGEAWVEKRILSALKLKIGDSLTVGEKKLIIARIITYEPDQQSNFYSFSPRVMIHADDLEATGILQPGSHVHYSFLFSGDADAVLKFNRWVKPRLNPSQRIMDIHDDRPELGSTLSRAERYLGLSSIVVVIISGVAIAMATRRYSERHIDATALLRCLGCKQKDIVRLYGVQFTVLGLTVSAAGCLIGWFSQQGLFYLLKDLLPRQLAGPGLLAIVLGMAAGLTILFGFALPPLLRLKRVSALRVLRREIVPLPSSARLIVALALTTVSVLIWRYTDDLKMTMTLIVVGTIVLLALALSINGLLRISAGILPGLSLAWRYGLQGILRNNGASVSQILAFSLTLVAMILSFTIRTDLIDTWKKQLPDQAPNYFALNIFQEQLNDIENALKDQGITVSRFYPVVRGRLIAINDIPVQEIVTKDSQGENATHRELSLTWSEQLPDENTIVAGQWWGNSEKAGLVSVEHQLAQSLKIGLFDQLTFTVGSQPVHAVVGSIRELQWDTMKPNFYMIFSPGTLDSYPNTWMTSFYLPENKLEVLNGLVKKFPGMTILEIDLILGQLKTVLAQLTEAINYLLYFALMAAFTVLFASVITTLDSRIQEGALMRTLGAHRRFLIKTHLIEFSILGLVSGLIAVVIAEILTFSLYRWVMHLDYHPSYWLWVLVPLAGSVLIGMAGCWGVRSVVNQPPIQVLRNL